MQQQYKVGQKIKRFDGTEAVVEEVSGMSALLKWMDEGLQREEWVTMSSPSDNSQILLG